jgi:hypothetical protein
VSCVAISHIYKDACSLTQAKGLPSLIYHYPALDVRFVRWAVGTTSFLTIRGFRRSKSMENSWRVSPLTGLPSLTRLPFEWISMIALSCSLRTPICTT